MLEILDAVLNWMGALPPGVMAAAVGVLMALEASVMLGVVVPGDVGLIMAVASVGSIEGVILVVFAAAVGSLLGESGGYLIGSRLGPSLRKGWLGRRIGSRRWERSERYMRDRGAVAAATARYFAAAHAVLPLIAGAARMPYRRFIAWSAVGAVTWASLYGVIGSVVGHSYRVAADNVALSSVILLAVVILAGGIWFLTRRHHGGSVDQEEEMATTVVD